MLLTLQPAHDIRAFAGSRVNTRAARRLRNRAPVAAVVEPAVIEFTWANRRPGTAGFARWAAHVGQQIDEWGLAATAGDVDKLVGTARRLGVALVAADVLADPTQPEPARHRAFAHVVSALTATPAPIPA